ncbi:MAG: plasmid recombination protein [Clostridia bacterium]|nr:plasmid recombination protein [Clostridia bacterium]
MGTIHFDEVSPHIHIVGVPVSDDNKRGMKKQVAKSKIFNRESLTELQDKMRNCCIKSYNKYYEKNSMLKQKQKGRNQDIKVKDMGDYRKIKKQLAQKEEKLQEVNNQTNKLDIASNDINEILDNLKPTKLNKNNMLISSENVEIIKNYTKDVKDTTKTIRNVNDLNMAIRDFEHSAFEVRQENSSLKYELELKDEEIGRLKNAISKKDKIIDKLQTEKESLKQQLQKFKGFWHKTIKYFQDKINYNGDKSFIEVAKDLFINKIFDNHEYEIVTDRRKKVKTIDEIEAIKGKKKNNMELK